MIVCVALLNSGYKKITLLDFTKKCQHVWRATEALKTKSLVTLLPNEDSISLILIKLGFKLEAIIG
jgi:hypothetical protein